MTHDAAANPNTEDGEAATKSLDALALVNAHQALKLVSVNLPWLSPLTYKVRLEVNASYAVAAVNRQGRIYVNPKVFATIPLRVATFVIAHELLHIALDTFSRESAFDDPTLVNRAHDYIINDMLAEELSMECPLGGLFFYGASNFSLEKMVAWMMDDPLYRNQRGWLDVSLESENKPKPATLGTLSSALKAAGIALPEPDSAQPAPTQSASQMFDDVIFPSNEANSTDESSEGLQVPMSILEAVRECLALKAICRTMTINSRGMFAANDIHFIEATKAQYHPSWQRVLQRWLEAQTPTQRSFSRPSRRGAHDHNCVLPGRIRSGWTLHIILDTSGSMTESLAQCLGAISEYCSATGVAEVRLIQCDAAVSVDELVDVDDLRYYRVAGFGGSDLSPAMNFLDEDLEVQGAIIITDGVIDYPKTAPHYEVLWTLTFENNGFKPGYGSILPMYFGN